MCACRHRVAYCRDLNLAHLTACTRLALHRKNLHNYTGWRDVAASDTLPPGLQALSLVDCRSASPLLPLTALTALTIAPHCSMVATELSRLSTLTGLQRVVLGYEQPRDDYQWFGKDFAWAADHSAAGWASVPGLVDLQLREMWFWHYGALHNGAQLREMWFWHLWGIA